MEGKVNDKITVLHYEEDIFICYTVRYNLECFIAFSVEKVNLTKVGKINK